MTDQVRWGFTIDQLVLGIWKSLVTLTKAFSEHLEGGWKKLNQVELNDIGSQEIKDSMRGRLIKVLLSRETHKWDCARWNGIQNQKVFLQYLLMLTGEWSSRDRIFDTTE